jgi:hypothetical protein
VHIPFRVNSAAFPTIFSKTLGFVSLRRCTLMIMNLGVLFSSPAWCGRLWFHGWPRTFRRRTKVTMAHPLEEIVRRDRRWFRAHPERRYRCRLPAPGELDRDACNQLVIIAIRHIGGGHLAYQPVIFEAQMPTDDKSAGILFALAAKNPDPIPTVAEREVSRWRFILESLSAASTSSMGPFSRRSAASPAPS